ncbi:hypothetical protein [Stygiolobus caldivivus]|uniref:Uncharacterized protein n=1 Tax=Stygiolobus caldivivus TaxID=2824673 RepID=A0A8D5U4C3_9CREN|nr:hypothetical protein [Stygiolobus caldivivus]BCU68855.1 hypothetical protein KN1_01520 [Stygiolobus caldivivus]
MKLALDPVLKAYIKRAYIENYKRNSYNKITLVLSIAVLIFVFSLLLLPTSQLHLPTNSTLYSRVLYEAYGITLPPTEAAVILSLTPIIVFLPSLFTLVLSSSIPYYFLYNLRVNSEIEVFLSYLGGPRNVFSIITKATLIFTLIYYTIYYGVTTILVAIFLPVLLTSAQFLTLFYVGGFMVILLTILLMIILSLKFPSLSRPSMSFGRSTPPSLALPSLIDVVELLVFEIISASLVAYSQITTLVIVGLNSLIVVILTLLFVKLRENVTVEDFINR